MFLNFLRLASTKRPFLKDLITRYEPRLLFKNFKRKFYATPGASSKGIAKDVHCKKAMGCVFMGQKRNIPFEMPRKINRLLSRCSYWSRWQLGSGFMI
ncbi:hypothetical protein TNCV_4069311 [Trichonephila clavipes]|nr:hypothetical protein TNCV_4069311 [Trichonephila clavipes]